MLLDPIDVLMAVGPRTTETTMGLLSTDDWEEIPVWPLAFFTSAESDPDFEAHLLFQESDAGARFMAVGSADPDGQGDMAKIIADEENPGDHPDVYGKMAALIGYATREMENGKLRAGRFILWSELRPSRS